MFTCAATVPSVHLQQANIINKSGPTVTNDIITLATSAKMCVLEVDVITLSV